jgi:hypothetical protein
MKKGMRRNGIHRAIRRARKVISLNLRSSPTCRVDAFSRVLVAALHNAATTSQTENADLRKSETDAANNCNHCQRSSVADVLGLPDPARALNQCVSLNVSIPKPRAG